MVMTWANKGPMSAVSLPGGRYSEGGAVRVTTEVANTGVGHRLPTCMTPVVYEQKVPEPGMQLKNAIEVPPDHFYAQFFEAAWRGQLSEAGREQLETGPAKCLRVRITFFTSRRSFSRMPDNRPAIPGSLQLS